MLKVAQGGIDLLDCLPFDFIYWYELLRHHLGKEIHEKPVIVENAIVMPREHDPLNVATLEFEPAPSLKINAAVLAKHVFDLG